MKTLTKAKNGQLIRAQKSRYNEFYTQLETVEDELQHYRQHFAGKVVYCNCDDYRASNFVRYFKEHFAALGLRRLEASCYVPGGHGIHYAYDGAREIVCPLRGNGDFASHECVALLKQADIVVTNPPFSPFIKYINLLTRHGKDFLIIGNMNAVTYLSVFNMLKVGMITTGINSRFSFIVPCGKIIEISNALWYTTLLPSASKRPLRLCHDPIEYDRYANYDAINVDSVRHIPAGYAHAIGVPVSLFLFDYSREFDLVYLLHEPLLKTNRQVKVMYKRAIIRRKTTPPPPLTVQIGLL